MLEPEAVYPAFTYDPSEDDERIMSGEIESYFA
jgi:hypothetical protein